MTPREKEVLCKVVQVLKEELDPPRIILFGSRAKATNRPQSDFDLAVDMRKSKNEGSLQLDQRIEAVCGLYGVDVIYLLSVEEAFKNIILKTGKVIYERGSSSISF